MTGHDALYHRLFSHPLMLEQVVREFVPEAMAVGLDFSRMERVVAKFHGRAGQRREGDVVWRLPTQSGEDIYLYVLVEFQSQSDWWMAVRTQVYEGLLWQQIVAERNLKTGDPLPPVLLLVLYNGEQRWTAPTTVADLIALPPDSPLWPWQPQVRYHLLDMGAFSGSDLAHRDSLAALLFRLEQPHDSDALAVLIDDVVSWFRRHPSYDDLKRLFTELVRQGMAGLGAPANIPSDLVEMKTMLATLGETWKQQWLAEGRVEGRTEGLAEGRTEGRAEGRVEGEVLMLIRFAEKRFGPLTADQRDRILSTDAASVDVWLDRLMNAPSLEALFSTMN